MPPMRSIQGDDSARCRFPWADVIVDVQGPYTRAEGGEMFVLSYHDEEIARAAINRAIQKLPVKARFVTREEGF